MTWTTPRTWTAGDVVTASLLNIHLRDNLNAFGGQWVAFTPGTNLTTIGDTQRFGRYARAGKFCALSVRFVFGATTVPASGNWTFTLPFAMQRRADMLGSIENPLLTPNFTLAYSRTGAGGTSTTLAFARTPTYGDWDLLVDTSAYMDAYTVISVNGIYETT